MYLPPHFTAPDTADVAAFVEAVAAADLVTFDGTKPVASLIPIIWDQAAGEQGRLLGHLALANPQWQSVADGAVALAIVHGPQAYVSPNWYPSKARHGRAVPTWNYVTVHFTGPLTVHRDPEWIRDVVTRLTRRHEAHRRTVDPEPRSERERPDLAAAVLEDDQVDSAALLRPQHGADPAGLDVLDDEAGLGGHLRQGWLPAAERRAWGAGWRDTGHHSDDVNGQR